jgi:carotenoid cleavage dioxygenase
MTVTVDRNVRSPYLSGNYAPIQSEITADLGVLEGALPADLAGVFVRNGANPRYEPKGRYHWFDGDGMVHAVGFGNGEATYRNRYVRTAGLASDEAAGECQSTGILEPPDFGRPGGPFKDTANTDLVFHAGQLLAVWWLGGDPHVIALPELETTGIQTYGGKRQCGLSAHPKLDMHSGELMWFDHQPVPPYLTYGVISPSGELVHQTEIDLPGARLQHDLAITPNHTILMDMSMMWDPDALARGKVRLGFFRDTPTRFGVIPRYGSNTDVRWFDAEPMFMYHTVNAWEDGDEIVLVGCRIDQPFTGDVNDTARPVPSIATLRLAPVFHEWRFDLRTGACRERQLDDVYAEFPRMDNRQLGRPTRYSYHQRCAEASTLLFDGVVKYDYASGATAVSYSYPPGWFGGETVFAPREGSSAEDDGYLVTFVVDEATGDSECYVLDAQRLADGPVCRLGIPQRVPTGYHTWWVTPANLASQRGVNEQR